MVVLSHGPSTPQPPSPQHFCTKSSSDLTDCGNRLLTDKKRSLVCCVLLVHASQVQGLCNGSHVCLEPPAAATAALASPLPSAQGATSCALHPPGPQVQLQRGARHASWQPSAPHALLTGAKAPTAASRGCSGWGEGHAVGGVPSPCALLLLPWRLHGQRRHCSCCSSCRSCGGGRRCARPCLLKKVCCPPSAAAAAATASLQVAVCTAQHAVCVRQGAPQWLPSGRWRQRASLC